jgi:hypothetical protein
MVGNEDNLRVTKMEEDRVIVSAPSIDERLMGVNFELWRAGSIRSVCPRLVYGAFFFVFEVLELLFELTVVFCQVIDGFLERLLVLLHKAIVLELDSHEWQATSSSKLNSIPIH